MLEKALALAQLGLSVFPATRTKDGRKIPAIKGGAGHLDSTTDPTVIEEWWSVLRPDADIGVHTGASGIVVLDIDVKDGVDGFDSLGFLDPPETYFTETPSGGYHYVYAAPEGVQLRGDAPYRGMTNVDRRGGSSWVIWYGEVPSSRAEFAPAPEWLCDPAIIRTRDQYEGDLKDWFNNLTPGAPSAAVRRTLASIKEDMSHDEMVKAQHHAIRLGAEGHPGVEVLIGELEQTFLNRNPANHVTPQADWEMKFAEALTAGIEQFGGGISLLEDLDPFRVDTLPANVSARLLTGGSETTKANWSKALIELIKAGLPDKSVRSILWQAPRTRDLSMDWGIEFVQTRIEQTRERLNAPEPKTIPKILDINQVSPSEMPETALLSDEERELVERQYTFVDFYLATGTHTGFANKDLYRPAAWNIASMAVGYKAFISPADTDILPLNLWFISLAPSGTGKTRAAKFEEQIFRTLFDQDNLEQGVELSGNISPQGLHIALLERSRQPTILFEDEAAGFFQRMATERWMESMQQDMSKFYDGGIHAINKVSQAELKGKTGSTSFHMHLYSTPENFFEHVSVEQFKSGYTARPLWDLGEEKPFVKNSIQLGESRQRSVGQVGLTPSIMDLAGFFWELRAALPNSIPIWSTPEAMDRQEAAGNFLWNGVQGHEKFEIVEPSMRRFAWEVVRKVSVIMALTNGFTEVRPSHVVSALQYVEIWVRNLYTVADQIDRSAFYQKSLDIVAFVASRREGTASQSTIYKKFAPGVQRDPRELQSRIDLMVHSGMLVAETHPSAGVIYRANR